MTAGARQVGCHVVGTLVTHIAASHLDPGLDPGLAPLVAALTGAQLRMAVHTDHHGAGDLARHRVEPVTHAAMTITAEQGALLAVRDLVLHQFVGYQEFVLRELFR